MEEGQAEGSVSRLQGLKAEVRRVIALPRMPSCRSPVSFSPTTSLTKACLHPPVLIVSTCVDQSEFYQGINLTMSYGRRNFFIGNGPYTIWGRVGEAKVWEGEVKNQRMLPPSPG